MDSFDSLLVPPLAQDARSQALAQLAARLTALDLSPLLVYLVDAVPTSVLPLLGEQFHIMGHEGWNLSDSAQARRRLIKQSIELHRYKGTPWSIKEALALSGFSDTRLIEHLPDAIWAEFDIDISAEARPITPQTYIDIEQTVNAYKPVRCRLRTMILRITSPCNAVAGLATLAGESVSIYPQMLGDIDAYPPLPKIGIGQHSWATVSVTPLH